MSKLLTIGEARKRLQDALEALDLIEVDWMNQESSLKAALEAAEARNEQLKRQRDELQALLRRLHGDD